MGATQERSEEDRITQDRVEMLCADQVHICVVDAMKEHSSHPHIQEFGCDDGLLWGVKF